MDRVEFEQKLLVRGGHLERWPAADAEAAKLLLAADAESRSLLVEVLASDQAVHTLTVRPLDTALIGRIMAEVRAAPTRRALLSGWRPMIPAGALAILLIASVGYKAGYEDGFGIAQDLELAAALAGDVRGLEDLP